MSLPRWRFGDDPATLRRHLEAGGILAIPTESSYGLAADARSTDGVEAVYRVKERDRGKPLPLVIADVSQLPPLGVDADDPAVAAVASFWPAALTLVVPLVGSQRPPAAAAGGATLAVRVPAHDGLRALVADIGFGLTATSANRAGEPPILDPSDLDPLLAGHPAIVVDGGILPGGAPSTLVTLADGAWRVLRAGRFDPALLPDPVSPDPASPDPARADSP